MKIILPPGWTSIGMPIGYGIAMYDIREPLSAFFADKDYGRGCKRIDFAMYCVDTSIFSESFQDGGHYVKRSRRIDCSVEMDFRTSMGFVYRREFIVYMKSRFLDKSMDFEEFNIEDFDCAAFTADLETFFANYLSDCREKDLPIREPEG